MTDFRDLVTLLDSVVIQIQNLTVTILMVYTAYFYGRLALYEDFTIT